MNRMPWNITLALLLLIFSSAVRAACPAEKKVAADPVDPYGTVISTNGNILKDARFDREKTYPQMNIRPIDRSRWISMDQEYDRVRHMKQEIERLRPTKTFRVRKEHSQETWDASHELLRMLAQHLTQVFPERFQMRDHELKDLKTGELWNITAPRKHPLEIAGEIVNEDLLLIREDREGGKNPPDYRLEGGFVAFPSRWELKDMMGLTVDEIHGAVDDYQKLLGSRVNGMIGNLRPNLTFARNNWFIYTDPSLALPGDRESRYVSNAKVTPETAGDTLFLRTEFETFVRLPHTQYILFTIKPHVFPLREVLNYPDKAQELLTALRRHMPKDAPKDPDVIAAKYLEAELKKRGVDTEAAPETAYQKSTRPARPEAANAGADPAQ